MFTWVHYNQPAKKKSQKKHKNKKTKKKRLTVPNSIMVVFTFRTPLVLRAAQTPEGTFENDGFFLCDEGVMVVDVGMRKISFVELGGDEKLVVSLDQVATIKCQRFRSRGRNHSGGKIAIFGVFDRAIPEKITAKMNLATFNGLVGVLNDLIEEIQE